MITSAELDLRNNEKAMERLEGLRPKANYVRKEKEGNSLLGKRSRKELEEKDKSQPEKKKQKMDHFPTYKEARENLEKGIEVTLKKEIIKKIMEETGKGKCVVTLMEHIPSEKIAKFYLKRIKTWCKGYKHRVFEIEEISEESDLFYKWTITVDFS